MRIYRSLEAAELDRGCRCLADRGVDSLGYLPGVSYGVAESHAKAKTAAYQLRSDGLAVSMAMAVVQCLEDATCSVHCYGAEGLAMLSAGHTALYRGLYAPPHSGTRPRISTSCVHKRAANDSGRLVESFIQLLEIAIFTCINLLL